MRIPAWMLTNQVTIKPYLGESAYGPIWGDPVTVQARIEPRNDLMRTPDGNEVVAAGRLFGEPGVTVNIQSEVTFDGATYEVFRTGQLYDHIGNAHHQEVWFR